MELVLGGQVGRTCAGARGFSCDPVAKNRRTRSPSQARALRPSWSVPPQCENDIRSGLREDFSNVKSRLNINSERWKIYRLDCNAKIKLWLRTQPSLPR